MARKVRVVQSRAGVTSPNVATSVHVAATGAAVLLPLDRHRPQ